VDPSRWDRLETLLEEAERIPAGERAAFVERETRGDPELRAELSTLLDASAGAADYLHRLRQGLLGTDVDGILRAAPGAADAPDPWIGRTVSHYRIEDRIGGGGMGVIYRARDLKLHRTVALKFIAPEIHRDAAVRQRFLDEARAASALDHPNICTIHEIAETADGRVFIVMAAYEGESLRTRIARGPLTQPEALDLAAQLARALAAAHERGIVHRDVKPDNVFVTRDGIVKLLDFGLARTTDGRMSGGGAILGTVAYMSPEQAAGRRADERSDVWALGVILFEMLAGVRPFVGDDPPATIQLILTSTPDLGAVCPDLPPALVDVVHRALSKDPTARFAHAGGFLDALGAAPSEPMPTVALKRAGRRRLRRVGAIVAGPLVIGAVVLVRLGTRPDTAPAPAAGVLPVSHVLWVDDDPSNNRLVMRHFTDRGVQVTTALNTEEALQRYDPAVHQLVISDMGRYEGVNDAYVPRAGLHLLERLRARYPDLQLIFCTSARAVATYRGEALAAGARDIVTDCVGILRTIGH